MISYIKVLVFLASTAPFAYYVWQIYALMSGQSHILGVDPGVELMHRMAHWALNFLMLTLSLTPLRYITGWTGFIKLRRMLGLFTFFYVCLHVFAYLVFILGFDWSVLGDDIVKRPYMIVGALAFLALLLMSLTSNRWSIKKLGKNWKRLHQLVYIVVPLVIIHFLWSTRASWDEPALYGMIGFVLLSFRLGLWLRKTMKKRVNLQPKVKSF